MAEGGAVANWLQNSNLPRNRPETIQFSFDNGLISNAKTCRTYRNPMGYYQEQQGQGHGLGYAASPSAAAMAGSGPSTNPHAWLGMTSYHEQRMRAPIHYPGYPGPPAPGSSSAAAGAAYGSHPTQSANNAAAANLWSSQPLGAQWPSYASYPALHPGSHAAAGAARAAAAAARQFNADCAHGAHQRSASYWAAKAGPEQIGTFRATANNHYPNATHEHLHNFQYMNMNPYRLEETLAKSQTADLAKLGLYCAMTGGSGPGGSNKKMPSVPNYGSATNAPGSYQLGSSSTPATPTMPAAAGQSMYPTPPASITNSSPQSQHSSSGPSSEDSHSLHYPTNAYGPTSFSSSNFAAATKMPASNRGRSQVPVAATQSSCMMMAAASNSSNVARNYLHGGLAAAGITEPNSQPSLASLGVNLPPLGAGPLPGSDPKMNPGAVSIWGGQAEPNLGAVFTEQEIDFPSIYPPVEDPSSNFLRMDAASAAPKKKREKSKKNKKKDKEIKPIQQQHLHHQPQPQLPLGHQFLPYPSPHFPQPTFHHEPYSSGHVNSNPNPCSSFIAQAPQNQQQQLQPPTHDSTMPGQSMYPTPPASVTQASQQSQHSSGPSSHEDGHGLHYSSNALPAMLSNDNSNASCYTNSHTPHMDMQQADLLGQSMSSQPMPNQQQQQPFSMSCEKSQLTTDQSQMHHIADQHLSGHSDQMSNLTSVSQASNDQQQQQPPPQSQPHVNPVDEKILEGLEDDLKFLTESSATSAQVCSTHDIQLNGPPAAAPQQHPLATGNEVMNMNAEVVTGHHAAPQQQLPTDQYEPCLTPTNGLLNSGSSIDNSETRHEEAENNKIADAANGGINFWSNISEMEADLEPLIATGPNEPTMSSEPAIGGGKPGASMADSMANPSKKKKKHKNKESKSGKTLPHDIVECNGHIDKKVSSNNPIHKAPTSNAPFRKQQQSKHSSTSTVTVNHETHTDTALQQSSFLSDTNKKSHDGKFFKTRPAVTAFDGGSSNELPSKKKSDKSKKRKIDADIYEQRSAFAGEKNHHHDEYEFHDNSPTQPKKNKKSTEKKKDKSSSAAKKNSSSFKTATKQDLTPPAAVSNLNAASNTNSAFKVGLGKDIAVTTTTSKSAKPQIATPTTPTIPKSIATEIAKLPKIAPKPPQAPASAPAITAANVNFTTDARKLSSVQKSCQQPAPKAVTPMQPANTNTTKALTVSNKKEPNPKEPTVKPGAVQSMGTNTPRRRSQDKKALTIREGLMRTGDFVVSIEESTQELPMIWRIEGKSLLQRFEPADQDGIIVYSNTSSYSAWNPTVRQRYIGVDVRMIGCSRTKITVEKLGLTKTNPSTLANGDVVSTERKAASAGYQHQENFEVFIQTLISQALDPNFITEIVKENDDYFLTHVQAIDDFCGRKKTRFFTKVKWDATVVKCVETFPSFTSTAQNNVGDLRCKLCHDNWSSYILNFYGDPYDPMTLEVKEMIPEIKQTKYAACDSCKDKITLFSRLHHQKNNFYQRCKEKVEEVRSGDENKESHVILEHCLQDNEWIQILFKELEDIWYTCDKMR